MAAEDWDDIFDFLFSRTICRLGIHCDKIVWVNDKDKIEGKDTKRCSNCKRIIVYCMECRRWRDATVYELERK